MLISFGKKLLSEESKKLKTIHGIDLKNNSQNNFSLLWPRGVSSDRDTSVPSTGALTLSTVSFPCDLNSGQESNDERLMGSLIFTMRESVASLGNVFVRRCIIRGTYSVLRSRMAPGNWEIARFFSHEKNNREPSTYNCDTNWSLAERLCPPRYRECDLTTKKKHSRDKEGQSVLSRTREGAETRIAVHYKRQTHKPVEYERPQFSPRRATLFLPMQRWKFQRWACRRRELRQREKEPHTFVKLDVENDA